LKKRLINKILRENILRKITIDIEVAVNSAIQLERLAPVVPRWVDRDTMREREKRRERDRQIECKNIECKILSVKLNGGESVSLIVDSFLVESE
jgi:hypothetical protein